MKRKLCLGLDTSNYTTSAALFDGEEGYNLSRLLEVPAGALGLRQSDALFQHVKRLPELFGRLRQEGRLEGVAAVGASIKPRWVEGSYMPCFLAGESLGRALADTLGVPFFPCSHQQGHLAAAAWSAGRADLLERSHLAWHLSGGTTELLYVEPRGATVEARKIGGTSDLSAGQLIDRTGKRLGLAFPAGKALDALASDAPARESFRVKLDGLTFSLSGVENRVAALAGDGAGPAEVARFALSTVADVIRRATLAARAHWGDLPVLCSGGVASNARLRAVLAECAPVVFAPPEYSADNALGVAVLARRGLAEEGVR